MLKRITTSLLVWLLAASTAGAAPAIEEIQTPYGVLEAAEVTSQGASYYAISFGGKQVGRVEADAVSLYHVIAPASGPAYIILAKDIAGLNCRHEFALVKITSPTDASMSDSFGNCMELAGAQLIADGVRVSLKGSVKAEAEEWTWKDGVLARASNSLLHYINQKYHYEIDYPSSFVGHGEPDAGDGQVFTVPGSDARLTVSGSYCGDNVYTPADVLDEYRRQEREGKLNVTYSRQTKRFAVVSGVEGSRIFYRKLLTNGSQCAQFTLEYDSAQKAQYDALTARIAASLKLLQD